MHLKLLAVLLAIAAPAPPPESLTGFDDDDAIVEVAKPARITCRLVHPVILPPSRIFVPPPLCAVPEVDPASPSRPPALWGPRLFCRPPPL